MDRQEAASILVDILWKEKFNDAWFPNDEDSEEVIQRNLEHEALQFAIDYLSDSCNR